VRREQQAPANHAAAGAGRATDLALPYSVPAVAEALKAQLQLKEQLGGAADDVISLSRSSSSGAGSTTRGCEQRHTIMSAGVEPGVPVRITWVGDKLTDESRWMGEGPRKGEVEGVQIVRLAYTQPTSHQFGTYAQAP